MGTNYYNFKIISALKQIGCCLKCSLRLAGSAVLKWKIQLNTVKAKRNFKNLGSLLREKPCVVCLGILQNNFMKSFTNSVINHTDTTNYDCRTVFVLLNLPSAIQIRERAVYTYISKKLNIEIVSCSKQAASIKDVWHKLTDPLIKLIMGKKIEYNQFSSPFTIEIHALYEKNQEECIELLKNLAYMRDDKVNYEKKSISKKNIELVMSSLSNEQFNTGASIPPTPPSNFAFIREIFYKHNSIYIAGRYKKNSRRLSQTPWLIEGKSKEKNKCIEEIISGTMIQFTKAQSAKFLSSGREDVDVRMLLFGRPFVVELINPKITQFLLKDLMILKKTINDKHKNVQICSDLKNVSKTDLKVLKCGEYQKSKTYRALCVCNNINDVFLAIDSLLTITDFKIIQKTPVRVLHRRSLFPRERIIYECRARIPNFEELKKYYLDASFFQADSNFIILDLKTQAGTYVKEFIHGDFTRTIPNLLSLLKIKIDIIALDVVDVALRWP